MALNLYVYCMMSQTHESRLDIDQSRSALLRLTSLSDLKLGSTQYVRRHAWGAVDAATEHLRSRRVRYALRCLRRAD